MPKITKSQVQSVLDRQRSLEQIANGLLGIIKILNEQLRVGASALYKSQQNEALDNIPASRLAGLSYQLTAQVFETNQIKSLLDLHNRLELDEQLSGVSAQELQKIKQQVKSIVAKRWQSTKLIIDFEKFPSQSARLVHFVRLHLKIQDSHRAFNAQLESYRRQGKHLTEAIRPEYFGRLRWLITTSETRNHLADTYSELTSLIDEEEAWQSQARSEFSELSDVTEVEEQNYFEANAATVYAQMERLHLIGTSVPKFDESVIPKTLADEVQNQPLHLAHFKSTLRGWQDFGAKFILKEKKVLLGDEMGLGKTVQALAAMTALAQDGMTHFLVVCPNSIIINWMREIERHTNLLGINLHGNPTVRHEQLKRWEAEGGVAVCNYESIWRMDKQTIFSVTQFLVADEAHLIKNPGRKRSDFVTELARHVEYALFMSGTALENHVLDMVHLIDPLQPELLEAVGIHHEDIQDSWKGFFGQKNFDHADSAQFKQAIAPVYLRRNRGDVLTELPALTQTEEWSEFSEYQLKLYRQSVETGGFQEMRRVGWKGHSISDIPKLQRLQEICNEAVDNHEKVIVFSFFRSVLKLVSDQLSEISVQPIMGGVTTEDRQKNIDEFINSSTKFVLPAQIDTLGYGLNLQAANVIVFAEPQIKPSTEAQALSRAYRMGQTKKVFVYRLLTVDSIDELLMEMLGTKQQLFDVYAKDSIAGSSIAAKDPNETRLVSSILNAERSRLIETD